MEKEVRCIGSQDAEVRVMGYSRNIEGYGIVFNSESRDLGGFTEVILPEAVEGVLERSDVFALLNHSIDKGVLARSTNGKGTLHLESDEKGVSYAFEAPHTALGDEVVEGVKRGDIRTSSFSFSCDKGQKWEKRGDGTWLRTITKFDNIFDVSPVYREAYEDTVVALRSLDKLKSTLGNSANEKDTKPDVATTTPEPIVKDTEVRTTISDRERELRQLNNLYKSKNNK